MKLDQIAFYAHDLKQAEGIKTLFGLQSASWVEDMVVGRVDLPQAGGVQLERSIGLLRFNYSFGIELEILTYLSGPHWHLHNLEFTLGRPFLSHHGFHLEDDEPFPEIEAPLVQEMWTEEHTNEYVVSRRRRYHYRIHDARNSLGVYLKFIKRIHPHG